MRTTWINRAAAAAAASSSSSASSALVPTISLANGAQIPRLGLGTWKSPRGQVGAAVAHALQSGYTHLDLAWAYRSESPSHLPAKAARKEKTG